MNLKSAYTSVLVYATIGFLVGLYLYYANQSTQPFYITSSSAIDSARNIVRGVGGVALLLAVYEYIAFDIRSGAAALLLGTGLGIRKYLGLRSILLVSLGLAVYLPMILIGIPFQDYQLVVLGETLSDMALIIGAGLVLAVVTQRVEVVVIGGLTASLVLKTIISFMGVQKNLLVAVLSSPYLYYITHSGTLSKLGLALDLLLYSILYSCITLPVFFILALKISKRRVYLWRP